MKNHSSQLKLFEPLFRNRKVLLITSCVFLITKSFAQVGISSTSITPDASSILELRSTSSGFLPPRMTTTQRDNIASPATGLLIYNTTTNQLNYYSGGWQILTVGGQTQLNGTGFVKATGTTISYDNSIYLTGNQSISWTGSGDVSGSASGTTSISPSLTVTGLRGSSLPSLTTGFLKYNGSAWAFDNSSYITNANVVFNNQSNTYSAGFKQIFSANGTSADIRLTGNTSDPSTLSAGDVWYNSTSHIFKGRFNTTTRQFATLDGTEAFTNKSGNISMWTNDVNYLTGNQSISWTGSGDVSGSASGTTSISPSLTITGLRGSSLPALSTGFLKYNGSSWAFDNTSYITNANVVFNNQSNTYSAGFKQIFSANGTNADIRLTGNTSDPSTLSAGDVWYNSTSHIFKGRFNTTTRQFATLDGTETFSNKDFTGSGNTFPTFNQNTTGTASNITGVLNAASFPALTGDVTTSSGSLATAIANNVVTNAKLSQMAANTIKGNNTGSTANASDLTPTQVTAMLPTFTSSANGIVPASGGGTDNFLRADGIFTFPVPGLVVMTAVSSAINTTETNLISFTLPANFMLAGTTFRVQVYGTCTSSAANASNIRVRLGTAGTSADALVAVVTPTAATSGTNIPFTATLMVTIRTAGSGGTAGGGGNLANNGTTGISSVTNVVTAPTSGVAVNTTVSNIIHVSYQSAATTTTSTFQVATIEVVNK